jgi:RNA polymerase sigma-70 factor (ECF subfamily)
VTPDDTRRDHASAPLDGELLRRVRRRDPTALERFFDHYYDRIHGHVARLVQDAHLAEDLTHEIFLRLNRALDRLDPDRDPTGWVFTVATNCVRDHWRSRRHKEATRSTELTGVHLEVLPDRADHAEQQLARRQEQAAVRAALAELSDSDREVILLRDYEQLDSGAVAAIIGAKPAAVRQRHSRAVTRLGQAFRRYLDREEQAET